jgi:hypothetical protein
MLTADLDSVNRVPLNLAQAVIRRMLATATEPLYQWTHRWTNMSEHC